MAAHPDDGFHEIQLNGKQLVFLFMAATVVSVVIFLCGVLVGRGVRVERGADTEVAQLSAAAEPLPNDAVPAPAPAGSDPTAAAAPKGAEDLSYFDRLETAAPVPEQLKAGPPPAPPPAAPAAKPVSAAAPPAAPPAAKTASAAPPPAAPPAAKPASAGPTPEPAGTSSTPVATSGEPSGAGYAVQIAALNIRSEADAIAKRLTSKGYAAYVMTPALGSPQIYRVRIGKFGSRRDAESIATKLEKEEQFKPWITR